LPTIQKPQEITDAEGQQFLKKMKRPSRHPRYNQVLASEQTDDEAESTDNQVRTRACSRLILRKSRQDKANQLGITVSEIYRRERQAKADKLGITLTELYRRESRAAALKRAQKPGIKPSISPARP
jgi:hypothetical protein